MNMVVLAGDSRAAVAKKGRRSTWENGTCHLQEPQSADWPATGSGKGAIDNRSMAERRPSFGFSLCCGGEPAQRANCSGSSEFLIAQQPWSKNAMIDDSPSRPRSPHSPRTALACYLRQINETALLDAAQERELAGRIQQGDREARDHLVRANLRLVVNIARPYAGKGLDMADLIAEGNLGLLRAVEGYDASMNTRFSTYAVYWVKQSIRRALLNTSRTVRLPAYMVQILTEWRRATATLHEELGRPPLEAEVARRLKLSNKKLRLFRKAFRVCSAMPQGEQGAEGWTLEEWLVDGSLQAPEAALAQADELRKVLELVDELDNRARTVLRLRFGLDGQPPRTLREIGARLGLTRERVRQIERVALAQLQEILLEE
jgi:RNA polymerase primary sigma factor